MAFASHQSRDVWKFLNDRQHGAVDFVLCAFQSRSLRFRMEYPLSPARMCVM
jgi:hypothetical protein